MQEEQDKGSHRVKRIGFWMGPILAAAVAFAPMGGDISPEAQRLAAITVWMATWWMTETVNVAITALLPLVLFPLMDIQSAKAVAPRYGGDLIWLFFGGFQLAFAVERWNLHRRLALFMVRVMGTRADRLVLGFMLAAGLLSMWLFNTSTTLMLLPVAMAVAKALEPKTNGPFGIAMMLGLAYAASVGGMGTYLGTAPNGVFRGVAEEMRNSGAMIPDISFGHWMLFAAPLSVILIIFIWLYLTRVAFKLSRTPLAEDHPARVALSDRMGPMSQAEIRVAIVFLITIVAWIARRSVLDALGMDPKSVTDATIAVIATLFLYVIPAPPGQGQRALLSWDQSAQTPWHILILFGGGFALAGGFGITGLSTWLGDQLAALTSGWPLGLLVLAVVLFMTFLTEVTSNTATATVLLPVIGSLALSADIAPAMLMLPATLAASCAFMLPVATPPNAIVYGSGLVSLPQMARVGLWINIGTAMLITLWMLTWGQWVLEL